jgi:adenylate kinase family enzyme
MLIKDLVINLKQKGVVFCGFPKTIAQAKALDLFLFSRKNEKPTCVFLKLDPITALGRFGSADDYRIKQNEFNLNSQPVVDYYSNNKIEIEASNKSNVELNNEILKCISI